MSGVVITQELIVEQRYWTHESIGQVRDTLLLCKRFPVRRRFTHPSSISNGPDPGDAEVSTLSVACAVGVWRGGGRGEH